MFDTVRSNSFRYKFYSPAQGGWLVVEKGLGKLSLAGGGDRSSSTMRAPFCLPISLPFALTCNPWLLLGGRVPRLVVVVGVIFLTKPPLRPLLPETQEASSFRSSPVEDSKVLIPKLPFLSLKHHSLYGAKRMKCPESLRTEQCAKESGLLGCP